MKVRVVAPFALAGLDRDDCLEVAPGTRVRDLLARTGAARLYWGLLPVTVNGTQVDNAYELAEGDVVVFVRPMGGG